MAGFRVIAFALPGMTGIDVIALGWTALTGALEWVRCKAGALRNTGAYTISYVRISEGRQRRPFDLDQGPERREGQIARYSAPPLKPHPKRSKEHNCFHEG